MSMIQMECYPTLRERGQITIPEETRELLGLQPGDRLELTVEKSTTED
jgi:AbrB family looped-hinge helix DNA binding protein